MTTLFERYAAQIALEKESHPNQWESISALWEHDINVTYVEFLTAEERERLLEMLSVPVSSPS